MNAFDFAVSSLINQFSQRSLRFDLFVVFLSGSRLLKGGVIIGLVCWAWFRYQDVQAKREALVAAVLASFPALAIARFLELTVHRPRPFNEPLFTSFKVPHGMDAALWEGTSSFPSDHAVLFFALAVGILFVSRRMGWLAFVYVATVICLPRIYIGQHYATDILTGGAIGAGMAWLLNRPALRELATGWALRSLKAQPGAFYCLAFLVVYQMVELFTPVLDIARAASSIVHAQTFH